MEEIVHEVLHSLGFIHEQSRADRDQYVRVLWENIEDKYKPQFDILSEEFLGSIKHSAFDYHSVMIYEPTAFAKTKGTATLQSTTSELIAPSENGLSPRDIERVKSLFNLN